MLANRFKTTTAKLDEHANAEWRAYRDLLARVTGKAAGTGCVALTARAVRGIIALVLGVLLLLPFGASALYQGLRRRRKRLALREVVEFEIVRHTFMKNHSLPPTFDLARYLRLSLAEGVAELVDVGPLSWLLLGGMALVYWRIPDASAGQGSGSLRAPCSFNIALSVVRGENLYIVYVYKGV